MMGAPSRVNKAQLDDVHIILNDKKIILIIVAIYVNIW